MLNIKIKKGLFELILNTLVEAYNNAVEPRERLSLVKQGTGKMTEVMREIIVDTQELYVCVYNDKHISVFKRKYYSYCYSNSACEARGFTYSDLFSDAIGIFGVAGPTTDIVTRKIAEKWQPIGYSAFGFIKPATVNMVKAVSYEEVRTGLRNAKEIGKFKPGKTTASEIDEVLRLAPEYLGLKYIGLPQEPNKTK